MVLLLTILVFFFNETDSIFQYFLIFRKLYLNYIKKLALDILSKQFTLNNIPLKKIAQNLNGVSFSANRSCATAIHKKNNMNASN